MNMTREQAKEDITDGAKYDRVIDALCDAYEERIKELQHFHDTTVGLFVTDRPDLVNDTEHEVLFELIGIHKGE